ncbi:hypothetical protein Q427_29670 [Halomonas sp. BC04]|nr:hypothetical protein Q427_29670 [Halomonas sp. BC04]
MLTAGSKTPPPSTQRSMRRCSSRGVRCTGSRRLKV